MNPQTNQTPGLGLPQPSFEIGQASTNGAPASFHPPQAASSQYGAMLSPGVTPESAPTTQAAPPVAQQPAVVAQAPSIQVAAVADADDGDNGLDEEWVNKAQEIVQRTHSDPYLQSRELGKLKSQFVKARYNKDIKGVEDQE